MSNSHVPSVFLPAMKHTSFLFLVNIIKVSVVTHVNVKSSPTVALSDDVVSVKPETNRHLSIIICYI
jgi:hypothetical protein